MEHLQAVGPHKRGIRSLFTKKGYRGNRAIEEDLDNLVTRNIEAMGDADSYFADLSNSELNALEGSYVPDPSSEGANLDESLNETQRQEAEVKPNVQDPAVPEKQSPLASLLNEVNGADDAVVPQNVSDPVQLEEENINSLDNQMEAGMSAWLDAFNVTSNLDEVEKAQFVKDILSLDDQGQNVVITSMKNGVINSVDELRDVINNQASILDQSQGQSQGMNI